MLYVAYGSNLNREQMRWRCPSARAVATAILPDYRLMFKGSKTGSYLTIEPCDGEEVPVVLWSVTAADVKNLDMYEGYPHFYYKKSVNLSCDDGKKRKAFVYIMHEDRPLGVPSARYVGTCAEGYQDFGFDLKYIRDAIEYSKGEMTHELYRIG